MYVGILMTQSCPKFCNLSRRTIENTALYLIFVGIYCFSLNSIPGKLELFESWVDFYLPNFEREWRFILHETFSMRLGVMPVVTKSGTQDHTDHTSNTR